MKDQHKKIKGYRDLSQEEIDLMNRIKEQGECLRTMINDLRELNASNKDNLEPLEVIDRMECLNYAEKDLKQGIMWAVRSVALPDSF